MVVVMKQKCVIFGAGAQGTIVYGRLSYVFDIVAYSDNNNQSWGKQKNGVTIIPPDELPALIEKTGATIFIANKFHHDDIADQLDRLHLQYFYFAADFNLCYERNGGVWAPTSPVQTEPYKKPDPTKFAVLFVQNRPCTRTDKIANALRNKGVLTYAAYTYAPSVMGTRSYEREFPFWSYAGLLDFVNNSEFDVIHCSNSPDILVNILIHSNKKVIHDCHDIHTIEKKRVYPEEIAMEFIANTQADGVISTTEQMRDILMRRYGTVKEKTFVLGNYPLSSFENVERLPKLSAADGRMHCVYEGGIVDKASAANVPDRYFEPIFLKLAQFGIHVHIYSQCVPEYLERLDRENPNIHYEGHYSGEQLIKQMTQYDLGLLLFPGGLTAQANSASPNKLYEYLSARLPVVTNIRAHANIIEKYHCGGMVDLTGSDIPSQFQTYQKIEIPCNFCETHGCTMNANADRLLAFYRTILLRKE